MARPKKPKVPLLAIINMERLPRDVLEQLEQMAAQGATVDDLQKHIMKNGFSIRKTTIKKWTRTLPFKKINTLEDLPEDLREKVVSWWLSRRDYASCVRDLTEAGFKADNFILNKLYGQILRDETQAEINGDFDPTRAPISKELEAWALTATLDRVVDAIMRSKYRPEPASPADFAKMADILLKVVNSNISRRRLDLDEEHLMARARAEFEHKISEMLIAHPELVEQIAAISDEAEAELIAK